MSILGVDPVRKQLLDLAELARCAADEHAQAIDGLTRRVLETLRGGGKLLFCGNGGSAADAQHLAAEYVVRYQRFRRALPAVALTTDSSVLTAIGNDLGFESVFSRQIRALAQPGDLLILHSTSGESENLVRAALAAREMGVASFALLARSGGRLASSVDEAILFATHSTARAQEVQIAVGHVVCDLVERVFAMEESEVGTVEAVLQEGRRLEKEQTLFYRALSGAAEEAGDAVAAERLNELLADEQHHVSRITARLLELGVEPVEAGEAPEATELAAWQNVAREREEAEVRWYEEALERVDEPESRAIFEEILASERHHRDELGGKWMSAAPPEPTRDAS